ncbi:glycosyltransferase family 87 protein [Flexivirga lutea]
MGARFISRSDDLLTRARLRVYPSVVLVMFVLFWTLQVVTSPRSLLPDFRARWTAGVMVVDGRTADLYDPVVQSVVQRSHGATSLSWFVSPPPIAVAFAPFGALSYPIAALLWTAISIVGLTLIAVLLRPYWNKRWGPYWCVVLIAVATQPVLELVGSGQDSWLVLLAGVSAVRLLHARHELLAGAVLSVGVIAKPQLMLAAVVLALVYAGLRVIVGIVAGVVCLVLPSLSVLGPDMWVSWIHAITSPTYDDYVTLGQAHKSASLQGFFTALAPATLTKPVADVGLVAGILLFVLWSVWLIRCRPTQWIALSTGACVTVLAAPHAMVYDLTIVLPAIAAAVAHERSPGVRVAAALGFITVWLGPLLSFLRSTPWPLSALSAQWAVLIPLGVTIRLMTRGQRPVEGHSLGIVPWRSTRRLRELSAGGRGT